MPTKEQHVRLKAYQIRKGHKIVAGDESLLVTRVEKNRLTGQVAVVIQGVGVKNFYPDQSIKVAL